MTVGYSCLLSTGTCFEGTTPEAMFKQWLYSVGIWKMQHAKFAYTYNVLYNYIFEKFLKFIYETLQLIYSSDIF